MRARPLPALLLGACLLLPAIGAAKDIETGAWSEVAAANIAAAPDGFPDNIAPSQVKAIVREIMAALKRDWDRSHATISSSGTANAYVLTYAVAPAAYAAGQQFSFIANFANTAAATADVNSLGPVAIKKQTSAGLANLAGGDIQAGQHVLLEYDDAAGALVLLDPQSGAGLTTPVSVANGGTGNASFAAHQALIATGATTVAGKTVPDCPDTSGSHLNYAQGTDAFSCGSSSSGSKPTVATKTANYTVQASDCGTTLVMNSSAARTFSLPADATAGNGCQIRFISEGTGATTLDAAGTDTIASGGSTSLGGIVLNQGDSGFLTADGVTNGIWWWTGTRHYDSGQQTITSGGTLSLSHGLGVQPMIIQQYLHNVTAEDGYAVGDEVNLTTWGMGSTSNLGVAATTGTSTIAVIFGSNSVVFTILNKSSGSMTNVTNVNWKYVVKAYVFN